MNETCFTQTVSIQRLGEKNRTDKQPVHHGGALLIRMENIGKSLHLALAGPRVAQCVSIDHLGVQDRNIAQNHGLLRNALVPGFAKTDDTKKEKSIGDGKAPAKCMEMPFDAQLNLLSAAESMRSSSSLQVHAPGSTQAHRCDFRAVTVHGLDVS